MPNVLGRVAVRNRRCGAESDQTTSTQPLDAIVDGRIHVTPRLHPPAGDLAMSISFDLPADVEEQLRRRIARGLGVATAGTLGVLVLREAEGVRPDPIRLGDFKKRRGGG